MQVLQTLSSQSQAVAVQCAVNMPAVQRCGPSGVSSRAAVGRCRQPHEGRTATVRAQALPASGPTPLQPQGTPVGWLQGGILQPASAEGARLGRSAALAAAAGTPPPQTASQQPGTPEMAIVQRVAYQGVPGAYSELAASRACPSMTPLPCEQFEGAFQALDQWMADRAVLPIENSLGGSIHAVYDLMLRYKMHIVGEIGVPVNHCLLALPGVRKEEIRRVLSHPQALAQTDNYTRGMPGVVKEAVDDTAGAARMIAENGWRDAAAVASRRAGELYGLEILDEGIQDMKDNVTRFLVLSRDPLIHQSTTASQGVPYKTSIVFSMIEGPGVLFKALSVFALRDINLTKIESRPKRSEPLSNGCASANGTACEPGARSFNYLFYIDFMGGLFDEPCQNALRHLSEISTFLRVLGSYPADTSLGG